MQTKINSMIPTKAGWQRVTIFGYSNKSVPGLEIQGLGQLGRNMKEKFIFLCKERNITFPFKRYLLCIDLSEIRANLEKESTHYLELPFLMTFFYLGGLLPIRTLADCLTVGRVSAEGKVTEPKLPLSKLVGFNQEDVKIITSCFNDLGEYKHIPTQEVMERIPGFEFISI